MSGIGRCDGHCERMFRIATRDGLPVIDRIRIGCLSLRGINQIELETHSPAKSLADWRPQSIRKFRFINLRIMRLYMIWRYADVRRHGVGRALIEYARKWAGEKGVNQLRLMAAESNDPAKALFDKCGFRTTYNEMVLPINPP